MLLWCGVLALARFVCPESSKDKTKTDEEEEDQEEPEHLKVKKSIEKLGPSNNTINKDGHIVLDYIKKLNTFLQITADAAKFLNLVRYIHNQITENMRRYEELHIVLLADGFITNDVHSASWLVPPETITDMILYPPWNCAIDANVAYGISTGCILPKHREFRHREPQRALPDRWSSMVALQSASVPKIKLGPMKTDADEIMQDAAKDQIMELYHNHKRLVIPYPPVGLAADFPARPLYEFIAVIGLILKTQSRKATIHLAAGLEYKGHPPPNVQMWQNLYAYTPDGTVMTTKNMERHHSFVPLETITDTILYSPWNCAIDPKVTYGISAGCILPHHRAFRNGEPQGPLPGHWNSMAAQRGTGVLEIILGPLKTDLDGILKPPFIAGLEYRGRTPPDVNMWQNLYAYTPNGTVMTLQNTERSAELLFREMAKTAEVHDVLGNLGQYSNTIDTNGRKVLESLSNLPCEISHWIRAAGNAILCLNLVRYIYGSIANQAHPASWLVPLETITDTILYSPWNCAIDVKVAYSISTGCILPGHRDFRNWEPQGALPEDWNSMAAQQRTGASCKFSRLEIIEGSENFLLGACPL
ncbi:hypothetical protein NFI96_009247 [Prochilodus magdalenae]|nr:hypothetical protein NFI96_009247 [Prochilodus magdalenae]